MNQQLNTVGNATATARETALSHSRESRREEEEDREGRGLHR